MICYTVYVMPHKLLPFSRRIRKPKSDPSAPAQPDAPGASVVRAPSSNPSGPPYEEIQDLSTQSGFQNLARHYVTDTRGRGGAGRGQLLPHEQFRVHASQRVPEKFWVRKPQ